MQVKNSGNSKRNWYTSKKPQYASKNQEKLRIENKKGITLGMQNSLRCWLIYVPPTVHWNNKQQIHEKITMEIPINIGYSNDEKI